MTNHAFLIPHSHNSTASMPSSSTSNSTCSQLGTLHRQLYIANIKLQAISHSTKANSEIGLLHWELKEKDMQIDHLQTYYHLLNARKGAAEAHCMLWSLEVQDLWKQLDEQKCHSKCQHIYSTSG